MSRSPAIGFVAWNLSDAYIGGLLVGAHVAARRYGLQLLLFQGVPKELLDSRLAWERVDGWIAAIHVEGAAELAHAGVPVVTIAARVPGACPAVLADNHGGVCAMVRHLIEHGHRRIAFAGWMVWEDIQQRYAGYCAALADHGIPLDHDLVIPLEEHDEHNGRVAVQQLLSAGMPCTAIVAATDGNAIGAMAALHEAGYRVPEDVAVTGFNDEHLAQYTTPALTTVRQRYDALGSTAVDVLREHIAGRPVPEITYVPTVPILRESCGCGALLQVSVTAVPSLLDQQGWQEALAEQLLRLALYPQVHDPATPPTQVWPGVTILIRTLDAAIHGAEPPAAADQMRAWSDLVALTSNFEAHLAILALLERVGDARLVAAPDPAAARVRLTAFYDYARLSLLRALRAYDLAWIDHLEMQVQIHHDLITTLFGPHSDGPPSLEWLRRSPVVEGCLGLWVDQDSGPAVLTIAATYHRTASPMIAIGHRARAAAFPPAELILRAATAADPEVLTLLPIRTASRDWGVMALRGPLMIANRISEHVAPNTLMWARQMGVALEREALRNEVAKQQAILLEAYERERSLASENARLYQQARQSEAALRQVNEALERRIAEATADLRRANAQLQAEIAQRAQAEEERLKLERQLFEAQKLESLGVLAGGVAHDFNNLLVVILGNAGLALMDLSPDSPARASVEQIEIAARRAADLTRQLLAYAGRGRFVMQRLDLGALVADMIDLLKASIGKHVALQYQAPPTLPAIEADATQIRQVVMNLVINASEAIGAEPGTITITIGTRWIDQAFLHEAAALLEVPDGWYVCLAVSDTGCGMDDSTRARIFEPFYSTKFTGRGLGLSAVLGIVRSHKGTLTVQSMPGQGSTFTVLLPAIAAPAEAMPVPATRSGWQGHGTVLVVDDEPEVRTFAQRVLERSGLKVLTAADGVAAIEMLTAHAAEISCILLDLTMAHMGGEQAFAQIRRLRPELPVVVMSGYTAEDVASRFTGAYPTGFVQKPFTPQELRAALQQALEGTSSAAAGDREASGVADKQGGPP